jgi:hypothetical protein
MSSRVHETSDIFATIPPAAVDWDAVYAQQLPRVYNFLRYRTGDEALAEELTARTFEKAWRKRHRYRRARQRIGFLPEHFRFHDTLTGRELLRRH